jgi:RNA polymerase sigma-70 factor (ECF subfamily)
MHVVTSKVKGGRPPRRRTALLGGVSEAALLKRAQGKDVGAFEELVGRTEDRLYRLAMRYVRNESDAQEILQNAYLSAWRSLSTFAARSQFGSWMHRITVNASLMVLRTRNRHPEVAINDVGPMELNDAIGQVTQEQTAREEWSRRPDEEFQSAELRRRIEVAVNSLPRDLRSIFLLRDVWEMSTEDSAAKLRVSIPAAKTRLHRARRELRESLGYYVAS